MHKKNPYRYHGFRSKCRGFPLFWAMVEKDAISNKVEFRGLLPFFHFPKAECDKFKSMHA